MVNVPSPVVPYAPTHIQRHGLNDEVVSDSSIWQKFQQTHSLRVNEPHYQTSNIQAQTTQPDKILYYSSNGVQPVNYSTMPNATSQHTTTPSFTIENKKVRPNENPFQSPAADFSSFKTTMQKPNLKIENGDYEYDEGYEETDRIDVPSLIDPYVVGSSVNKQRVSVGIVGNPEYPNRNRKNNLRFPSIKSKIDPNALVYSSKTAPYGQQFPSYVPHSIETLVGSTLNTEKQLSAGNNIVYGRGKVVKSKEGIEQSRNLNDKHEILKKSSDTRNIFMTNDSFEKEIGEKEYYDYDSEYYEYIEPEGSGDYDDIYNEKDIDNLKKQLVLFDKILNDPSSETLSKDAKDDMLPDLVKLWKETMKRVPKSDLNG